jgi:gluconolactonase
VPLGGGPNGIAMGPDGYAYLCNNGGQEWRQTGLMLIPDGQAQAYDGGRIERVDFRTGDVEVIATDTSTGPLKAPNDLVFDRTGGPWFTDVGNTRRREMDRGGLYYIAPGGRVCREMVYPIVQPNGIGLSADETALYVVETATGRVWAFDLAAPGVVERAHGPASHGGRLLATLPDYRLPDSLAVDAAGNICVATLMRGGISVVHPSNGILRQPAMPDVFTTNLCFAGPGSNTVYASLSSTGLLVSFDWSCPGLSLNFASAGAGNYSPPAIASAVTYRAPATFF